MLRTMNTHKRKERWNMRIKDVMLESQQLATDPTMRMKAIEHILAGSNRAECVRIISMAYERIEYFDKVTEMLKGGWFAKN